MEIFIFLLTAVAFLLTAWLAKRFYAHRQENTERVSDSRIDVSIPVLGISHSGKTMFLASLGEQLRHYTSQECTVRCFTKAEEQKICGKKLADFDRKTAGLQPSPPPSTRLTKAMIFYERLAFEQGQNYHQTLEPENAYFRLEFAGLEASKRALSSAFIDVPGEYLRDERGYEGHINPLLDQANGLVLVVDGEATLAAKQEGRRADLSVHYSQVLEYFCRQAPRGPIWVVITKADALPEHERDLSQWQSYVFDYLLPQLNLRDTKIECQVTLSSADSSCQPEWQSIIEQGESFILSLKKNWLQQRLHGSQYADQQQRLKRGVIMGALGSLLMSWFAAMTIQVRSLPVVSGTIAWDWGSLKVASQPYLQAKRGIEEGWSPLALYTEQIDEGMITLNKAHKTHLEQKAEAWAKELGKQVDFESATHDLNQDLDQYVAHQKQSQLWYKKRGSELRLVERIEQVIKDVKSWQQLQKRPVSLKVAISDLSKATADTWTMICDRSKGEDTFACAITQSYQSVYQKSLAHALTLAISRSQKAVAEQASQVRERLSPLLRWKSLAIYLPKDAPLLVQQQKSIAVAWQAAWQHLNARLSQDWVGGKFNLERLKAIQQFEEDRRTLETLYSIAVPMPTSISKIWKERLNREVVISKRNDSAQSIIVWAQDYLDYQRAARVHLSQKELEWRNLMVSSLNQYDSKAFNQALIQIEQDLNELASLGGASEIKEPITLWQKRLKTLQIWGVEQQLTLNIESIECDDSRFKALGLSIDEGSWSWLTVYYPDRLSYYVKVTNMDKVGKLADKPADKPAETAIQPLAEGITVIESGEDTQITWAPWQSLKFSVYDQDGDLDHLNAEENDDDLVGEKVAWQRQRQSPQGLIQVGPEGVCSLKMSSSHPLPKWLHEIKWLTPQTP